MSRIMNLFISSMCFLVLQGCATMHKNDFEDLDFSESVKKVTEQQKQMAQEEKKANEKYKKDLIQKYDKADVVMINPLHMKVRVLGDKEAILASVSRYEQTGISEPILTHDNVIVYPFGLTKVKMICATLRVCSIELQEGERVKDVLVGDSERWNISFANSGVLSNQKPHVMVKPLFKGNFKTNLIITTERRVYNIELGAVSNGEYTPRISFFYPQDVLHSKMNFSEHGHSGHSNNQSKDSIVSETDVSISSLNFSYKIKGNKRSSWFPKRVFDDGRKVFIQMSPKIHTSEAPVFLVLGKSGEQEIVNYRFKSPYYVVDKLFDKGVLILGTKEKQTIITIVKK